MWSKNAKKCKRNMQKLPKYKSAIFEADVFCPFPFCIVIFALLICRYVGKNIFTGPSPNLQTCNSWTGQYVIYKSVNQFWLNLSKQNSKTFLTSNDKKFSHLQMNIIVDSLQTTMQKSFCFMKQSCTFVGNWKSNQNFALQQDVLLHFVWPFFIEMRLNFLDVYHNFFVVYPYEK